MSLRVTLQEKQKWNRKQDKLEGLIESHSHPVTLSEQQLEAIAAAIPPVDISGKVDKEAGKELSSNDYTDEEKSKLAGLNGGLTQAQILTRQL